MSFFVTFVVFTVVAAGSQDAAYRRVLQEFDTGADYPRLFRR
jgi:hypothetical protein